MLSLLRDGLPIRTTFSTRPMILQSLLSPVKKMILLLLLEMAGIREGFVFPARKRVRGIMGPDICFLLNFISHIKMVILR